MGGGTTAIACKNTNRKFIGCEKDDKWHKYIQQHL
jgi:DNA modification methylase